MASTSICEATPSIHHNLPLILASASKHAVQIWNRVFQVFNYATRTSRHRQKTFRRVSLRPRSIGMLIRNISMRRSSPNRRQSQPAGKEALWRNRGKLCWAIRLWGSILERMETMLGSPRTQTSTQLCIITAARGQRRADPTTTSNTLANGAQPWAKMILATWFRKSAREKCKAKRRQMISLASSWFESLDQNQFWQQGKSILNW